ncbi:MAG: CoA transferase [Betaproteobacteria bacterium]|nr:MAG: CoA transferase [Betaproteobacteria bacterium]
MPAPLEGIRVVDIGISTAGPYAARLLGDLGADVVKVEPLDGENTRSLGLQYGNTGYLYHVNNYNKRSITLRVQHPRGRDIFLALVARADVVVENFAIGTMDKWGIGYDACRAANPAIVYCSVKGFGESGPWRDLRAFDTVTQALSGIMHSTGGPGTPPLKAGPSVCDLLGAAVSSMASVAALVARQPGESQFLDTALFDMGAWSLACLWPLARRGDADALRSLGNGHPRHAPFGDYACVDGRIMLTVTEDAHWRALAAAVGMPAAWDRDARLRERAEIDGRLSAWLAPREAQAVAGQLQASGVPAAPILDLAQVATSRQTQARELIGTVRHPAYGEVPLIHTPLATGAPAGRAPRRLQPTLGEHNREIIGDLLGYGAELDALRAEGVIL